MIIKKIEKLLHKTNEELAEEFGIAKYQVNFIRIEKAKKDRQLLEFYRKQKSDLYSKKSNKKRRKTKRDYIKRNR